MIYDYLISNTANGKVYLPTLESAIDESSISISLNVINTDGNDIHYDFNGSLDAGEITILESIHNAHDGVEPTKVVEPAQVEVVAQSEPEPFAKPSFRTKRDGASTWIDLIENETKTSDFVLVAERYVSGGECLVIDAQKGDWISAEVVDIDNHIPEAARPLVCENHPTVNKYVLRANLMPGTNKYVLDTYPLNAKLTVGLYLRITYHASAVAGTRSFNSNYYLTQKLDP